MQVKAEGGAVTPATELDASAGDVGHRFPRFLPDGKHFMYATIPAGENGHQTFLTALGAKDRTPIITSERRSHVRVAGPAGLPAEQDAVRSVVRPEHRPARRRGALLVEAGLASGFMAPHRHRARRAGRPRLRSANRRQGGSSFGSAPKAFKGTRCRFLPAVTPEIRFSPDGAPSRHVPVREQDNPMMSGCDIWLVGSCAQERLPRDLRSAVRVRPCLVARRPDDLITTATRPAVISSIAFRPRARARRSPSPSPEDCRSSRMTSPRTVGRSSSKPKKRTRAKNLVDRSIRPETSPRALPGHAVQRGAGSALPDGRWLAYLSDESGRGELYIQSFPTAGSKIQVSNGGANLPSWRRDGKRLFFLAPDGSLMGSDVHPGDALRVEPPVKLFRFPRPILAFDFTADGKRLLARDGQERRRRPHDRRHPGLVEGHSPSKKKSLRFEMVVDGTRARGPEGRQHPSRIEEHLCSGKRGLSPTASSSHSATSPSRFSRATVKPHFSRTAHGADVGLGDVGEHGAFLDFVQYQREATGRDPLPQYSRPIQ